MILKSVFPLKIDLYFRLGYIFKALCNIRILDTEMARMSPLMELDIPRTVPELDTRRSRQETDWLPGKFAYLDLSWSLVLFTSFPLNMAT